MATRTRKKTRKSAARRKSRAGAKQSARRTRITRKRTRATGTRASAARASTSSPRGASSTDWNPPISSQAVAARTGRDWNYWIALIDRAKGRTLGHQGIVALLDEKHGVEGWWAQMLTVGYEQARGLRQLHQKPEGFEISASRVIAAPVESVFSAWMDETTRARWLPESGLTVHKSTPYKSLRATWTDGSKSISVNFYPRGDARTQVALQHGKLADAAAASRMKSFWGGRLDALKTMLGG